jgi:hypothetical protein
VYGFLDSEAEPVDEGTFSYRDMEVRDNRRVLPSYSLRKRIQITRVFFYTGGLLSILFPPADRNTRQCLRGENFKKRKGTIVKMKKRKKNMSNRRVKGHNIYIRGQN